MPVRAMPRKGTYQAISPTSSDVCFVDWDLICRREIHHHPLAAKLSRGPWHSDAAHSASRFQFGRKGQIKWEPALIALILDLQRKISVLGWILLRQLQLAKSQSAKWTHKNYSNPHNSDPGNPSPQFTGFDTRIRGIFRCVQFTSQSTQLVAQCLPYPLRSFPLDRPLPFPYTPPTGNFV